MTDVIAENRAAEVQSQIDHSGHEITPRATFSMPFEKVRELVESSPAPRRPNRNKPIHDSLALELEAWEAASDEALEKCDKEFPPVEN